MKTSVFQIRIRNRSVASLGDQSEFTRSEMWQLPFYSNWYNSYRTMCTLCSDGRNTIDIFDMKYEYSEENVLLLYSHVDIIY